MKTKENRYYELVQVGGVKLAHVYDQPYVNQSLSMSIVPVVDLSYYWCQFNLSKVWGESNPWIFQ